MKKCKKETYRDGSVAVSDHIELVKDDLVLRRLLNMILIECTFPNVDVYPHTRTLTGGWKSPWGSGVSANTSRRRVMVLLKRRDYSSTRMIR